MQAPIQNMTDKAVAEKLLAYLRKNGPYRAKAMFKNARVPYGRSLRALEAMEADNVIEQIPDGSHRNIPVFAWAVVGDTRSHRPAPENRVSFGGAEVLLAMQAAARSRLTGSRA